MQWRQVKDDLILRTTLGPLTVQERTDRLESITQGYISENNTQKALLFLQLTWASMLEGFTCFRHEQDPARGCSSMLKFDLCGSEEFRKLLHCYTAAVSRSYWLAIGTKNVDAQLIQELTCEMFKCAAVMPDEENALESFYVILYGQLKDPGAFLDIPDILRVALKDLPGYEYKKARLRGFLRTLRNRCHTATWLWELPGPQRARNLKTTERMVEVVAISLCKELNAHEIYDIFLPAISPRST